MKRPRYTKEEIVGILKAALTAGNIRLVCGERNISEQTFYRWCRKYGDVDGSVANDARKLKYEASELKNKQPDLTAKGRLRREALLLAILRIIARDGPGAVTLRSVSAHLRSRLYPA